MSNTWAGGAVARPQQMKAQRQQMQQKQMMQQKMMIEKQRAQEIPVEAEIEIVDESEVKDVVDLPQVIESMNQSSEVWPLIIDTSSKIAVVSHFIQTYAEQGITIQKEPAYYVHVIDVMSGQTPEMLAQPFPNLLRAVAVIDYDFGNGQDKDAMALKFLGQEKFEANKKRLGL